MARVRWGNVARLAALIAAVAAIALWPRGESETIPLDGLPGEAAPVAELPPRAVTARSRDARPRRRPVRVRRRTARGGEAVARAAPVVPRPPGASGSGSGPVRVPPPGPQVPEVAREFSFDR